MIKSAHKHSPEVAVDNGVDERSAGCWGRVGLLNAASRMLSMRISFGFRCDVYDCNI